MANPSNKSSRETLIVAFEQNHATFRSLNQQMWQIPLISMTLTGGLWFGVSGVSDFPLFQISLLLLAMVGNIALVIIIVRLRFVMGQHLAWLETNFPQSFVSAKGDQWYNKPLVVRTSFQVVLLLAATISLLLLISTVQQTNWQKAFATMNNTPALTYYENHAVGLADQYESLEPEVAHLELFEHLRSLPAGEKLNILDVGSGSGRDAAWLASFGHKVVAAEPSAAMRRISRSLHPSKAITWIADKLPELDQITNTKFDLIVVSAVWMHVQPDDRPAALLRLSNLLNTKGQMYLTLRLGPADQDRGIYSVTFEELRATAEPFGLQVEHLSRHQDLLGRDDVQWVSVAIRMP